MKIIPLDLGHPEYAGAVAFRAVQAGSVLGGFDVVYQSLPQPKPSTLNILNLKNVYVTVHRIRWLTDMTKLVDLSLLILYVGTCLQVQIVSENRVPHPIHRFIMFPIQMA